MVAVEVDHSLVEHLREKFAGESRLEVVHSDVLQTDLAQWGPAPIAGNLPYYITSPILEKTARLLAPRAVFLIQKEVAERLAAAARRTARQSRLRLPHGADRPLRQGALPVRGQTRGVPSTSESGFRRGAVGAAARRSCCQRSRWSGALRGPLLRAQTQDPAQ
ncbi:hypothetical protein SBA3_1130011 [Candidatus Sulfopaludibacter sp. SbA3]|nr:hypothetical protein SBA3_1130011 [Candidatus Sulfopaludibacter sp. SbA3]